MKKTFARAFFMVLGLAALILGLSSCGKCKHKEGATEVTLPTCTEEGYTLRTCEKCGFQEKYNYRLAVGHAYGAWSFAFEDFCTKKIGTRSCSECGVTQTESTEGVWHDYTENVEEPTCIEDGYTLYQCKYCEDSYIGNYTSSGGGHSFVDAEVIVSTCSERRVIKKCTACGFDLLVKEIPTVEHAYGEKTCNTCDEPKPSEGLVYMLSNDGMYYIVKGMGTCTDTAIVIPEKYNNLPVKSIGYDDKKSWETLTSVKIPYSVNDIGTWAFKYCLGLTDITVSEYNEHYKSVDGNLYSKDGKQLVCYAMGKQESTFDIPDGVEKIGYAAFQNSFNLTDITFPDSVMTIENYAFENCFNLSGVAIGNSVKEIHQEAFEACGSLKSVFIPKSVEYISLAVFSSCGSLENITVAEENQHYKSIDGNLYTKDGKTLMQYAIGKTEEAFAIPEGVTVIGYCAFSKASNLLSVVIPQTVVTIENQAFKECVGIVSLIIPDGVEYIGGGAFWYCINLETAIIGDGVTTIGSRAFYCCSRLKDITLGSKLKSIESETFVHCNLQSIIIPESVESINRRAFSECDFTTVTIPAGVKNIEPGAFLSAGTLQHITVAKENAFYQSIDGNLYTKDGKTLVLYSRKSESIFKIPQGVEIIQDYAFYSCGLKVITIPDTIKSIGDSAFNSFSLGDGISIIFNYSDLVFEIGSKEYGNLAKFAKVVFNKEDVSYEDMTCEYVWGEDDFLFKREGEKYTLIAYCGEKAEITLPTSIDGRSYDIYKMWGVASSIIIPEGIESIGDYAFYEYRKLRHITLPQSIKTIGESAFSRSGLVSIEIPDNVKNISRESFSACSDLRSVFFGKNVESIGYYAFWVCNRLETIAVSEDNAHLKSIDGNLYTKDGKTLILYAQGKQNNSFAVPDGVTNIASLAFKTCDNLSHITLSDSVVSIGDRAFEGCGNLEKLTVGDGLQEIGSSVFWACYNLKSITVSEDNAYYKSIDGNLYTKDGKTFVYYAIGKGEISFTVPQGVEYIENYAFSECAFTSVRIADSVKEIGFYAFYDCTALYVVYNYSDIALEIGNLWDGGVAQYAKILFQGGTVSFANDGYEYLLTDDGFLFAIQEGVFTLIAYCGEETTVALPASVNEGETYKIVQMRGIINLIIPESIKTIDKNAFKDCKTLVNAVFENPEGWWYVTYIQYYERTSVSFRQLNNPQEAAKYLLSISEELRCG